MQLLELFFTLSSCAKMPSHSLSGTPALTRRKSETERKREKKREREREGAREGGREGERERELGISKSIRPSTNARPATT